MSRATAVLVCDHWFRRSGESFTTSTIFTPQLLRSRYLDTFDELLVLGRCVGVKRGTVLVDEADGRRVSLLVVTDKKGPAGALLAAPRLVRELRRHRDSPVLLRIPGMMGSLASLLALRGRPYGVELIGDSEESLGAAGMRAPLPNLAGWSTERSVRRAAGVAYVTAGALQRRYPAAPDAVVTNYSSIDLEADAIRDSPRTGILAGGAPVRLVTVGSLARAYKGIEPLLEAVGALRRRGRDVELTVVGGGALLESYEKAAAEAGLEGSVRFTGQLDTPAEVREVLDQADIYVHPSLSEGLPRAVIEAMARGLPCVATAVGGTPELIDPRWLVEPGNAAELARATESLIASPETARLAGKQNLEVARGYAGDVLKSRRDAFYRAVLDLSVRA